MKEFITKIRASDLKELPGDAAGQFKNFIKFLLNPEEAPPTVRKLDMGFVLLSKASGEQIGCFVAEMYELAKINSLKCQVQYEEWKTQPEEARGTLEEQPFYSKIFRQDGTANTAFELAIYPVAYNDNKQKSKNGLQKALEEELAFIQKHNFRVSTGEKVGEIIRLPAPINKFRIAPEYLKYIEEFGLVAGAPRDLKLNILNPSQKITLLEKSLHWAAQRSALLMTLGAAFGAIGAVTGVVSFSIAALTFMVTVVAQWSAKDFGNFDLAENLYREIDWISSKKLRGDDKNKISPKKLLRTSILFGIIAILGAGPAAIAGWATGMAFSLPSVAQFAISSLLATIGVASAITGGIATHRFFWGMSIWDNQIRLNKEVVDALNPVEVLPAELKAQAKEIKLQYKAAYKTAYNGAIAALRATANHVEVRDESRIEPVAPSLLLREGEQADDMAVDTVEFADDMVVDAAEPAIPSSASDLPVFPDAPAFLPSASTPEVSSLPENASNDEPAEDKEKRTGAKI